MSILENSLRRMTFISKITYVVTLLRSNQGPVRQCPEQPSWRRPQQWTSVYQSWQWSHQWRIKGRGPGARGPGSRLIFRPKWGPKNWKKFFFGDRPPLSQGLDDRPPPHPLNRYYNGTEYASGVFNLKAGDVITLTAHYYPDIHGPKIYMDSKHSYFGALMI